MKRNKAVRRRQGELKLRLKELDLLEKLLDQAERTKDRLQHFHERTWEGEPDESVWMGSARDAADQFFEELKQAHTGVMQDLHEAEKKLGRLEKAAKARVKK